MVPEFSVVIPVFNGVEYISRAVQSALTQTGVRYEVIVVDDGSTDDSARVVADVDKSVRILRHEQNRGLPAARNTGIRAARAKLIAFLDSDDWWGPGKLSAQAEVFAACPELGVVFSDFRGVDATGAPAGWQGGLITQLPQLGLTLSYLGPQAFRLDGDVTYALIRHTSFMHPSTVVARREVLVSTGMFDESYQNAEDLEFWIRLSLSTKFGLCTVAYTIVEQRATSLGRQAIKSNEHIIRIYSQLNRQLPDMPEELEAHVTKLLADRHASLGWLYRENGDRATARRHYLSALRYRFQLRTLAALSKTFLPSRPVASV